MSDPTVVVTSENQVVVVSRGAVTISTPALPPLTITEDAQELTASDIGRSIRVDPNVASSFVLPEGSAAMDGKFFHILVTATGFVDALCSGTNKIGDDSSTTLRITGNPYAHVTLEWVQSIGAWMIHRMGSISAS
jgi:hypothetical protein